MLVEKRVAGIIRWLERLKKSYSSGALESALMDAECARADLENLRLAVWEKVKPVKKSRPKFTWKIASILKPVILAAVIILAAVAPISRDVNNLAEPVLTVKDFINVEAKRDYETEKDERIAEAVSMTGKPEGQIRAASKQKTSAKTQQAAMKQEIQASHKTQEVSEAQASQRKSAVKKSQAQPKKTVAKQTKETVSSASEKTVAYDKVFSLMQTGQKALKNNNSVVKVK
ncbi:MAG: hypothetical protein IJU48_01440 [Synergistaceae bacterium]|nr:hypothetical protein [Synergistaceae bacterium]